MSAAIEPQHRDGTAGSRIARVGRAVSAPTAAHRGAAPLLAALTLVLAAPALAGDTLYKYVDDRGVVHFSNIPADARFEAVGTLTRTGRGLTVSNKPTVTAVRYTPQSNKDLFDPVIERKARENGLAPALVKAVIKAESNFDPGARSRVGAMGLMQLMPATAAELGVQEPFSSEDNIDGGTRYLRAMLDRFSNLKKALAAYNAGPTAVDRYDGIPPYRETQQYVKRVLSYYRAYDGDFD